MSDQRKKLEIDHNRYWKRANGLEKKVSGKSDRRKLLTLVILKLKTGTLSDRKTTTLKIWSENQIMKMTFLEAKLWKLIKYQRII